MTKKKYRYLLKFIHLYLFPFLLFSCSSSKNVAYFQNDDVTSLEASQVLYEARILPKDILTITISTINPEAATTFNMTVPTVMNQRQNASSTSQPALQSYLVGNDGTIQFPVIGTLHVGGLTTKETEQLILKQILPYMAETENPIVTVRLSSYSISVMGEVQNPGCYQVSREKVSVLEALAMAGDLTIYGVRNNVRLIREDATGKKTIYKLNLNDANLLNSPYYYLQQNDILYVEPNKAKAQNSDIGSMTTLWFSATSIVVSIASLLVNILR